MKIVHWIAISAWIVALMPLEGLARDNSEQQVVFEGGGGTRLSGTLLTPASDSPTTVHPAMLLLAGSGPTDRDGNQPPGLMTDLLKQIAQELANRGIASLRCDKRGMYANASQMPKAQAELGAFFSWENFATDAVEAYRFLCKQPHIDPKRVGILGHSEGGLLALDASRLLKADATPPAILVLASTPGRRVDLLITEQLHAALSRQGAPADQVNYFLKENARITERIRTTGKVPGDVPAGLQALYPAYLSSFLHSEFALDPCKLAADYHGPVLVIAGAMDIQVSPERDAKPLDLALASRKPGVHKLLIGAKASHNLKVVNNPSDPGFAGPVSPELMKGLSDWVVLQLVQNAAGVPQRPR
jgi:pimeloyl-ACP methyl ester carboxylesterase